MTKLTINSTPITVPEGYTVLQACEQAGIEIPVFCYHPKLSIAGNCRMCLVEMEKSPKPIASCAMPVSEGMVIHTDSPMAEKARQGTLELLLINHPLDCPICDQGGECDLQDITVSHGCGRNRFDLNKRAVVDKDMGPLIKTHMTRCIHCTRCVRFAHEIAGTSELGTLHRGEHMEITTLLDTAITSELSGNLIDICPVGALTNGPYAFHGRPWELTKTPSIDVMDAVGSHIRIDTKGPFEVMRILPRACDAINEDWISDKTRFAYDGLKYQRLDRPYIRNKQGKLEPTSWNVALEHTAKTLTSVKGDEVAAITGDLCDIESMFSLKKLMEGLGSPHLESRWNGSTLIPKTRGDYLFNTTIEGIEKADVILLIGTNPRVEASLINARIKKRTWQGGIAIGVVGKAVDLTYDYEHLGENPSDLSFLAKKNHPFTQKLSTAKCPLIILGQAVFTHPAATAIEDCVKDFATANGVIRDDWNGYNVLSTTASMVGAFDLGFLPHVKGSNIHNIYEQTEKGTIKVIYNLGCDQLDFERLNNTWMIYQGHHGDEGARHAHIVLPGCAYTEKNALFVNTEGRVQQTLQATQAPGDAKVDWTILYELATACNIDLPFKDSTSLYKSLLAEYPVLASHEVIKAFPSQALMPLSKAIKNLSDFPFEDSIKNFYQSNVIAKNSKIMAQCTRLHKNKVLREENA